jgi:hypothetical protein
MNSITRRVGLIALVVAIAASVTAVAVAQRGEDRTITVAPGLGKPGTTHTPPSSASAQVKQRLGVFRRGARSDDRPTAVDATYARSNGINLSQARRVRPTGTFVAPGQGVTCVIDANGAAVCTPDEAVGKDFLTQTCGEIGAGVVAVTGLVPDGINAVTIRRKDGSALNASVTANYLDARVPVVAEGEVPTAVEYGGEAFPVPYMPVEALVCDE